MNDNEEHNINNGSGNPPSHGITPEVRGEVNII